MEEKKDNATENTSESDRPWIHYFRKGKARVLSRGLVVGDPGRWRVMKTNRFASLGEDATNKVTLDDCTYSANIPIPNITDNVHERKETGEEIQTKETSKDWVNQVFGKTLTDQVKVSVVKEFLQMKKTIVTRNK